MFTTIAQIHAGFMAQFTAGVPTTAGLVPARYARQSSNGFAEGEREQYPQINIQDKEPEFSELWTASTLEFVDSAEDLDGDGFAEAGTLVKEPVLLEFRYDVATACKFFLQNTELRLHFLKNFSRQGFLTLEGPEGPIGVRYSLRTTGVERSDGVFETNHEFTLYAWIQIQAPEDVTLVRTLLNAQIS